MTRNNSFWTIAMAIMLAVGMTACGKDTQVAGPSDDASPQALGKPAAKMAAGGNVVMVATVTEGGTPIEGVEIAFSRSVSGESPVYAWTGTTDADGEVQIEIATGAPGYYLAKATNVSGEVIGTWGSIPINGGRWLDLSLPIGGRSQVATRFLLEPKSLMRYTNEELWSRGRLEVVDEIFAPEYVYHEPAFGDIAGQAGLKQAVSAYRTTYPDLNFTIDEVFSEGNMAVMRWTATGTHQGELLGIPPTGRQIVGTGINIARYENGKTVEEWSHWDVLGNLQQMGVVPAGEREVYTWGEPSVITGAPGNPVANKALIERVTTEFWNQHNADVLDETHSPNAIAHNPVIASGNPLPFEAYKQVCLAHITALPDIHVATDDLIAQGDKVLHRWTVTGTHQGELLGVPASGLPVTFRGTSLYRIADGKIVESWWAYDTLSLLQQIGAIPPLGG